MKHWLYLAALSLSAMGVAHSWLGERYVLVRLLRLADLPNLSGSRLYMEQILRAAWHVTSIAWIGLAGIAVLLAQARVSTRSIGVVLGITALASCALVLIGTHGRHFVAWLLFLLVGVIALVAA